MKNRINRRAFLKLLLAAAAGLSIAPYKSLAIAGKPEHSSFRSYLPQILNSNRPTLSGRVIHVHAPGVTNWNYNSSTYYGATQTPQVNGVNQNIADAMVSHGVTKLFDLPESEVTTAWGMLIPDYTPGKIVAIKVNFNNSYQNTCSSTTAAIDAIAQPINAVVRGLTLRGVRQQDIVVYDAIRSFSTRVYNELVYKDIQIHDAPGCRGAACTWNSSHPHALVDFSPPTGGTPTVRISDSLINADYLINMPIMKGHPLAGVTLGFKNHFGSTNNPSGMHDFVSTSSSQIDIYNGLVDLFANPHIRDKTVLTIGDAIYGSREKHNTPPQPWSTFDNTSPCSLLFSTDPVAVDCVMHDLLEAERGSAQPEVSNYYLSLAEQAGLGVFETGNPWQQPFGSGYHKISYQRIEL